MADEDLRFNLLADERPAVGGFQRAGRAASAASDDVLALAKRLDEIGKKSATARVGLAGDKEALAQLDKLDLKLLTTGRKVVDPRVTLDGAAKASAEISALDVQLDKLAAKSAGAEAATGAGGLSGPGGMGALIGAGVALSPILTTVAFGVGGLGLAAVGAAKPIADAASKTGGLEKNLKGLDPAQRSVALGLIGLKRDYTDFSQSLEPQVLGVFNRGLSLAAHLMSDVEPVAAATGRALDSVLGRVDAEFQSGNWQSFFGFMAREAGPDVQLIGNLLTDLLADLPPLLRDLQPLGEMLLKDADDAAKLVGGVAQLAGGLQKLQVSSGDAAKKQSLLGQSFHEAAQRSYPGVALFFQLKNYLFGTADAAGKAGKAAAGPASKGLQVMTSQAITAGTAVGALNSDLKKLDGLLSDQSAQIQWKQAQQAVTKAIRDTSGALDGNSKTALANRQLVIQSTQAALQYAQQERNTGHDVEGAARTLQDQIRFLIQTHDKSAWVRAELGLLRNALHDIKSERIQISVHGDGTWNVQGAGVGHGQRPGGPSPSAAAGLMVTGGTPGIDSVPIMAQQGELVVPTSLVSAGAVDHLRGRIPGFAAGGVVGQYGDGISGLSRWVRMEDQATIRAVESATARATTAALRSVSGGGTGREVARYALGYNAGTAIPYVLGGASPQGWDCSGFTAWVYEHFGLMPGHQGQRFGTSETQAAWVKRTPRPEVGGLAFFNDGVFANPGHVGVITGPSTYISAHSPQTGTTNSPMSGAVMFGIPPGRTIAGFESGSPQGGGRPLPGGGSSAANRAVGLQEATSFGWGTGPSWADLDKLWNKESGWRNTAQNPTSTAYGIAQFLDSTWATVGGHKTSNPGLQILYGLRYIQRRYGNPETAWAHEVAFNSYDGGGILPENVAGVGMRSGQGYQLHAGETVSRGGGSTFNITINLPPGSSREHGRQIVDAIVHYERAAGSGWRS